MYFNVKNFIGLICFFAYLPAIGMDVDLTKTKKIGVEIETSSIKTDIGGKGAGFIFCDLSKKELWAIEEDTLDQVFKQDRQWNKFDRNLEVKTVGGFDDVGFFLKTLHTMTQVISSFYKESLEDKLKIDLMKLARIIPQSQQKDLRIEFQNEDIRYFHIKSTPDEKLVRPQITYQLPLNKIADLFTRLEMIEDKKIKDFLKSLRDNFKKYKIKEFKGIKEGDYFMINNENENNENGILNNFNENFSKKITVLSENVRGFSYLFLFYWKNIFNNNKLAKEKEPGPKQFLPIMSRVPFSEIYDGLSGKEKEEFKEMFGEHIENHGKRYAIREYCTFDGEKSDGKGLTLADWYNSIINEKDRVEKMKQLHNGHKKKYYVDKLSPPPDLPDNYSMGLMVDITTKSALVEVRGYARIGFDEKDIDIDNVESFITREANWFFGS